MFFDEVIATLKMCQSDLELAANYGEFAEHPELTVEHQARIETAIDFLSGLESPRWQDHLLRILSSIVGVIVLLLIALLLTVALANM